MTWPRGVGGSITRSRSQPAALRGPCPDCVSQLFHANPLLGHCLRAAAKFLGCPALMRAKDTAGGASWRRGPGVLVCHSCVVPCSRREGGGGVPASAGELRRLGGAGCAPRGQPVWRSEESSGLCADDNVLVIPSQMLEAFAGLHPWGPLHREEGRGDRGGRSSPGGDRGGGGRQAAFSCCFELRGCPRSWAAQTLGSCSAGGCGFTWLKP